MLSVQVESSREANAKALQELSEKLQKEYEEKLQEEQQKHREEIEKLQVLVLHWLRSNVIPVIKTQTNKVSHTITWYFIVMS